MFVWWCWKPPEGSSENIAYWYSAYNDGPGCGGRQPGVERPLSAAKSGRSCLTQADNSRGKKSTSLDRSIKISTIKDVPDRCLTRYWQFSILKTWGKTESCTIRNIEAMKLPIGHRSTGRSVANVLSACSLP